MEKNGKCGDVAHAVRHIWARIWARTASQTPNASAAAPQPQPQQAKQRRPSTEQQQAKMRWSVWVAVGACAAALAAGAAPEIVTVDESRELRACSEASPCRKNQGNCRDNDSFCRGNLVCLVNNKCGKRSNKRSCTKAKPCGLNTRRCDSTKECSPGLVCQKGSEKYKTCVPLVSSSDNGCANGFTFADQPTINNLALCSKTGSEAPIAIEVGCGCAFPKALNEDGTCLESASDCTGDLHCRGPLELHDVGCLGIDCPKVPNCGCPNGKTIRIADSGVVECVGTSL